MESHLFIIVKDLQEDAIAPLNAQYRWLRIMPAAEDQVCVPTELAKAGWAAYCGCDSYGIYNGAFGPSALVLRRRKKNRKDLIPVPVRSEEIFVGGQSITWKDLHNILRKLLLSSKDLYLCLHKGMKTDSSFREMMAAALPFFLTTEQRSTVAIFTEARQCFKIVLQS